MKFYIDFEATQPGNEIIAIGAVSENGSTFKHYCKPKFSEVTQYITELTGIKAEDVQYADSFESAINALGCWCNDLDDTGMWSFHCYGDSDKDFLAVSAGQADVLRFTTLGLTAIHNLAFHLTDDSEAIFKYFNRQISLIRAYNWAKESELKQDHDPVKDAEMLKFVQNFVALGKQLPDCPYTAVTTATENGLGRCAAGFNMPSGKFFCKGKGKNNKNTHEFESCDAAINWLIETRCPKNDRELIRRDRMATKIMIAMKRGETYCDFIWWREK